MAEIKMSVDILEDEYTKYVNDAFDLKCADAKEVRIPFNFKLENLHDWHIGVVCGASGSGKSTILKQLGGEKPVAFDNNKALISNFTNMRPEDAARMLTAIGLSSVPTWLRPYRLLSNGEQYRARMAKMISECQNDEILLVDEYTSVVDRNVAKSMSYALQKYIRRTNKRIIVFSCHFDIFDWLQPDWIYDLNKGGVLEKNVYLRQRPTIELQVFRVSTDTWAKFKKHHYMTAELNEAAACFAFVWENKLVAFESVLPMPSGVFSNGYREHRLVVLPDFQGLGLGGKISEWMGGVLKNDNKQLYTKTVNPALGIYRDKNTTKWARTASYGKGVTQKSIEHNMMGGVSRVSFCHKYIGPAVAGFENLLLSADRMRYNKSMEFQLSLF